MAKPKKVPCSCCYCGTRQVVPEPPALVKCLSCKRDFRVYKNVARVSIITLTDEAKQFFKGAGNGEEEVDVVDDGF